MPRAERAKCLSPLAIAGFLICSLLSTGCGGGNASSAESPPTTPVSPPTPTPISLAISPATPSFLVEQTQQFTATLTLNNGSTQDVSSTASWTITSLNSATGGQTSTQAATIETTGAANPGLATGVAAGPIKVTATLNSFNASVSGSVNTIPLIDMISGQTYKGFEGGLYQGSTPTVSDPKHDQDGKLTAAAIQPLETNGNPSATGSIVVVGIGMSNWTDELCAEGVSPMGPFSNSNNKCDSFTFLGQAGVNPKSSTFLVDCAIAAQGAVNWINDIPANGDTTGNYTACVNLLASFGLSPLQVQVILWKDADGHPAMHFTTLSDAQGQTPSQYCEAHTHTPPTEGDADACAYLEWVAQSARFAKANFFPNVQQMFLHSRIYAGYAITTLNPEPFAYEYGLATKWLIQAQIEQTNTGTIDPTAGDLSYAVGVGTKAAAPWLAWGPYFWASGTTPRTDSEVSNLTWVTSDFLTTDYTHPSAGSNGGRMKVADIMVPWYKTSPYTTWFGP